MRMTDSKICGIGRLYDPQHPVCKSCPVGCMAKSLHESAEKASNIVTNAKTRETEGKDADHIKKSSHKSNLEVPCPKEEAEQIALAQFLDLMFWDEWFHVPNEGKKAIGYHMKMKRQGLKKGVPDNFIFRPTPSGAPGVVIELKRIKGGKTSEDQEKWLKTLAKFGWLCYVAAGSISAIEFIRESYKM